MFVSTHDDADGIAALVLFTLAKKLDYTKDDKFEICHEFGFNSPDVDVVLDMRPNDANYKGIVIDHHPDHPTERKYNLIHDNVPAGVIVFNTFKDDIPKEHWWKVCVAASGDGQPEAIPPEVFAEFPNLLSHVANYYSKSNKTFSYPLYNALSSLINAPCRNGKPDVAFEVLLEAKTPYDILANEVLNSNKTALNAKFNKAVNNCNIFDIGKNLRYVKYSSSAKLGGRLGYKLNDGNDNLTLIILNTNSNTMSIRGHLSAYLCYKFEGDDNVKVGGHLGFAGGKVKDLADFESKLFKLQI